MRGLSIFQSVPLSEYPLLFHGPFDVEFDDPILSLLQQLEALRSQNNLYGEAMALDNIARTYEYMANMSKACETLEAVSSQFMILSIDKVIQELVRSRL